MNNFLKLITRNGIIAALYVVLTFITYPFSYGAIQVRIAEIMILLCFFRKDYVIGLTIGCCLANLGSSIPFDWLFGALATLIAGLVIGFCKHLIVAIFIPIIVNGFGVGIELFLLLEMNFWISVMYVAIGEAIVMAISYIFFMIIRKRKSFYNLVRATQNIEFKC